MSESTVTSSNPRIQPTIFLFSSSNSETKIMFFLLEKWLTQGINYQNSCQLFSLSNRQLNWSIINDYFLSNFLKQSACNKGTVFWPSCSCFTTTTIKRKTVNLNPLVICHLWRREIYYKLQDIWALHQALTVITCLTASTAPVETVFKQPRRFI